MPPLCSRIPDISVVIDDETVRPATLLQVIAIEFTSLWREIGDVMIKFADKPDATATIDIRRAGLRFRPRYKPFANVDCVCIALHRLPEQANAKVYQECFDFHRNAPRLWGSDFRVDRQNIRGGLLTTFTRIFQIRIVITARPFDPNYN